MPTIKKPKNKQNLKREKVVSVIISIATFNLDEKLN